MNKELEESLKLLNDYTQQLKSELEKTDIEDFDFNDLLKEHNLDLKKMDEELLTSNTKLKLSFKKLHVDAISPKYNYESDSGFDLHSTEEVVVEGLGRALVPTGLSFDIKDGYEIQVRSKSGLAINQGLMCLNSPATIDSGFSGEIKVIIFNTNKEPFTIKKGMKVAQAVYCPVVNGKWIEPIEQTTLPNKDRGNNGFGSTGI